MPTRPLWLAATLAVALAAAGCGNNCNDQTPPVATAQNCTVAPSSSVTVQVQVCPKCDQGTPSCLVHLENVSSGQITLEPVSEVCDPNSSCPLVNPASCQASPLSCSFTAPAGTGNYNVAVATDGAPQQRTLTVAATGPYGCSFP